MSKKSKQSLAYVIQVVPMSAEPVEDSKEGYGCQGGVFYRDGTREGAVQVLVKLLVSCRANSICQNKNKQKTEIKQLWGRH